VSHSFPEQFNTALPLPNRVLNQQLAMVVLGKIVQLWQSARKSFVDIFEVIICLLERLLEGVIFVQAIFSPNGRLVLVAVIVSICSSVLGTDIGKGLVLNIVGYRWC